jgi:hypothetical protein
MKKSSPNPYAVLPALISPTPGFLESRFAFKHKKRTARPGSRAHSIDLAEGNTLSQYEICRKQLEGLQRDYESVKLANERLQAKLDSAASKSTVMLKDDVDKEQADITEELYSQLSSSHTTINSLSQTVHSHRERLASIQRELGLLKYQEELGDSKRTTVIHLVGDRQLEEALAGKVTETRAAMKEVASLKARTQEIDEANAVLAKERDAMASRANSLLATCSEDIATASDLQYQLRLSEEALRLAQEKTVRLEQDQPSSRRKKQA